jgi:MobA-like NTP transferase domain
MALGALIGAYQEDDSGGLRALLPLAGRTLIEYQARCVAAAGAAPIVVVVERVPQALQDAFERLRLDGIGVFPVSDVHEAVSRFEAGTMILMLGDGIAPTAGLVMTIAEEAEPAIATVPDDEGHAAFERIDSGTRWAGVALVDAKTLGSTAAILGDWDLQSTLLRRTLQDGARRWPAGGDNGAEPLLVERAEQLDDFQRTLLAGSREPRSDWASRYVLAPVEEFATEQLMETRVRPMWLVWAADSDVGRRRRVQPRLAGRRPRDVGAVEPARHYRGPPCDLASQAVAQKGAEPAAAVARRGAGTAHAWLLGIGPWRELGGIHDRGRIGCIRPGCEAGG